MNIKDDWKQVKSVLEQGQASSIYCSVATVNPDGTPHITPVGTVFLRDDQSGYFFDHYAEALGKNIDQNPDVCMMKGARLLWTDFTHVRDIDFTHYKPITYPVMMDGMWPEHA